MASLKDLADSLNINLPNEKKPNEIKASNKIEGKKRRVWLTDDKALNLSNEAKGVYTPLKEKGCINPIDQSHLSTSFIPPIKKGVYTPLKISSENLRGNPLKIAYFIFTLSKDDPDKVTDKVTQTKIVDNLKISRDSAKSALKFLLKNQFIERVEFKVGKCGWSKYKLEENLFKTLLKSYKKGCIHPFLQKGSNSSSNNINKTTTTNAPLLKWIDLDISPLKSIGFNQNHLLQLQSKSSPEIVQESIKHFAYRLKLDTKKYEDPLAVLMGVLRKGGAWTEANYESPEMAAMREIIEVRKRTAQRAQQMEDELCQMEFNQWLAKLSEVQKIEFIPQVIRSTRSNAAKQAALKNHFRAHVWPTLKIKLMQAKQTEET